jgi:hypothetical protein
MISYEIPEACVGSKKKLTIQEGLLPNNFVIVLSDDDKILGSIIIRENDLHKVV